MRKKESEKRILTNSEAAELTNDYLLDKKSTMLYIVVKRLIDIIGALTGLIVTSPVFILLSILYLFGENKGPVFFGHTRIGEKGDKFKLYKFRSMIVNAEDVLKNDKHLYEKYIENNYKLEVEEDPRITKVGRFLRETSLDELPQLLNVLKGEMSLVGPRPVVEEELVEYQSRLAEFLSVKPGVTGYWQICGRSNVGYPDRAELEFYYIDHQSFKLDLKIITNTILIVIARKGAY